MTAQFPVRPYGSGALFSLDLISAVQAEDRSLPSISPKRDEAKTNKDPGPRNSRIRWSHQNGYIGSSLS